MRVSVHPVSSVAPLFSNAKPKKLRFHSPKRRASTCGITQLKWYDCPTDESFRPTFLNSTRCGSRVRGRRKLLRFQGLPTLTEILQSRVLTLSASDPRWL